MTELQRLTTKKSLKRGALILAGSAVIVSMLFLLVVFFASTHGLAPPRGEGIFPTVIIFVSAALYCTWRYLRVLEDELSELRRGSGPEKQR